MDNKILLEEYNKQREELQKIGDTVKEVELLSKMVSLTREIYGNDSDEVIKILNEIGGTAKYIGAFDISISSLEEAKDLIIKKYGYDCIPYATTLLNLTEAYRYQGVDKELEDSYKKIMQIYDDKNMSNSYEYAGACNNFGLYYQNKGKYTEAISLHEKSLEILSKLSNTELQYATTLSNMIIPYKKMGLDELSNQYIKKTLKIYEELVGLNHPFYSAALNNLAILHYQEKEYAKALEIFEQSAKICKETFGEESDNYKNLLNNIEIVKENIGGNN